MNSLLEKLDALVARFEEVSTLITDPNVIADQQRYVKLTKEYKELEDLMAARKEYANLLSNLEEGKNMLVNEADPDLKELAREHVATPKTPYSKYAVVQEATKLPFLPATSSECMPSIAKLKVGSSKCQAQARGLLVDTRK